MFRSNANEGHSWREGSLASFLPPSGRESKEMTLSSRPEVSRISETLFPSLKKVANPSVICAWFDEEIFPFSANGYHSI